MKLLSLVLAVALVFTVVFSLSACDKAGFISGSGSMVDKSYDLRDFKNIEASFSFSLEITRSDSFSVVVSTRENIASYLNVVQSGSTLKLGLEPNKYTNAELKAVIRMPQLEGLNLSGASKAEVKGFTSSNNLDLKISGASQANVEMEAGNTSLDLSGASKINGQLKARDLQIKVSGASKCELSGSGSSATLDISGASQCILSDLAIKTAQVLVSGASSAKVKAENNLDLEVTGASSLDYFGNPVLGKVVVTGASKLNHK